MEGGTCCTIFPRVEALPCILPEWIRGAISSANSGHFAHKSFYGGISWACISWVYISWVYISWVYLIGVHLTGMYLIGMYGRASQGMHLIGMRLMGMHVVGVHLMGMHLMGRGSHRHVQYKYKYFIPCTGNTRAA
jgi:hypothetical protein